jgi:hypothetical protein
MNSEALGVAAEQIPEEIETYRKKGVSVSFTDDGRQIWTSKAHKDACLKAAAYHERSSCRMRGKPCA